MKLKFLLKNGNPAPERDYFVMKDGSVWCDNYNTFESQEASIGFDNCIVRCPDVVWEVDNS